jgi:nitroreductase
MEAWLNTMGLIPESQRAMYRDAVPKQAEMLLHAGALVIPCFQESESLLGEKSSLHELNAFASMWAVIENILIAGASEGVHGVTKIISTPTERDHVRTTLAIPESYEIPCYLALGYPHEHTFRPEQIPVRLEERIHINRWPS